MQILRATARHPLRSEILYRRIRSEIGEESLAAARRRILASAGDRTPRSGIDAAASVPDRLKPYTKYLDIGYYLRRDAGRALDLGLHRARPQRVLDIGCGSGFFLAVCRHLGHAVQGLDLGGMPVFDELTRILGIPRLEHEIEPEKPLPSGDGALFDLVSAFNVRFDRLPGGGRWTSSDWEYFLEDVRSRLRVGGRFVFKWNRDSVALLRRHARFGLFACCSGFETRFLDASRVSFRRVA